MPEVNASGAEKVHTVPPFARVGHWRPSLKEFAVFRQFDAGMPALKPISLTPRRPADLIRALRSAADRPQPSPGWRDSQMAR